MDYLNPVKNVYSVPYRTARRFSILLSCMCLAYISAAGPLVLIQDFAGIPFNAVACLWIGPLASFSALYSLFSLLYVIFTERPLFRVVTAAMILVFCQSVKLPRWEPGALSGSWWPGPFWTSVLVVAGLFLLYRLLLGRPRGN